MMACMRYILPRWKYIRMTYCVLSILSFPRLWNLYLILKSNTFIDKILNMGFINYFTLRSSSSLWLSVHVTFARRAPRDLSRLGRPMKIGLSVLVGRFISSKQLGAFLCIPQKVVKSCSGCFKFVMVANFKQVGTQSSLFGLWIPPITGKENIELYNAQIWHFNCANK